MTVRRVVTGDVDGRSRVIVDGPAHEVGAIDEIWAASPDEPLGVDPTEWEITLEPPAGGVRFRVASIPPNSPRFHVTNTVDYLYVLDGDVTLELDDGACCCIRATASCSARPTTRGATTTTSRSGSSP